MIKVDELQQGKRYYSNVCGHRFWYYTGVSYKPQGYPYYGKTTVYQFEDIADHTDTFTADSIEKYFEVK